MSLSRLTSRLIARGLQVLFPNRRPEESELIEESQKYWTKTDSKQVSTDSHWRGHGPFDNDELWQRLGRTHLELVQLARRHAPDAPDPHRVVEWGCGGGMNAVHLAPQAKAFFGVEISQASLTECEQQVAGVCQTPFKPILVAADRPEDATQLIAEPIDLFLCTYVFELIPSPGYGKRILEVAHQLLVPGGIAIIHIRYHDGNDGERSKYHAYQANVARMTTYSIPEFWQHCTAAGFRPLFVTLVPKQPELREERYAYFALQKGTA